MKPACTVEVDDELGVRVARVSGSLDVFSASVVGARILSKLPSDTMELVLDLDDIAFMDSAGVSALVRLRENAKLRTMNVHAHLGDVPHVSPTLVAVLRRVFVVDDVVDLTPDDEASVAPAPFARTT
jgi:anti-anti-sigma factor